MESFLTPEEIKRIRQEEVLRAEIRKELAPPAPATDGGLRQKVWKFLNSNFGIWLLSTVVLAGVVNIYNCQQAEYKKREAERKEEAAEKRRTREVRERIKIEISYRFSSTMTRLKAASEKYKEPLDDESQRAIIKAFDPLRKPSDEENPPLYPEYKSYSGLALIAELRRHSGDAVRPELKEILAKTSGFIEETVGDKTHSKKPASLALELLRRMKSVQWDNGFPYTDCDDTNPFC